MSNPMLSWKTLAPLLAVLVVVVVAIGARFMLIAPGADGQGKAAIGGPFTLVSETGETVTEKDFAGKFLLIYFGYTYCPDVCPTGLTAMAMAMDDLTAEQQANLVPLFISVDPERDTVEAMRDYTAAFHPDLIGLTGSPEQVAAAAKEYKVYYAKAEQGADAEDYLVDHTAITYLMGPDGAFLTHFSHGTAPEKMAETIAKYMGK